MRPLPQPVSAAFQTLARLGAAIPRAWGTDRVFRYAAIGAGLALATLMARPWVDRSDRPDTAATSPPVSGVETPGPDTPAAPLPPPGARYEDPAALNGARTVPAETPRGPLAPGRALEGLRIEAGPDAPADPFGTLHATDPAFRPQETPWMSRSPRTAALFATTLATALVTSVAPPARAQDASPGTTGSSGAGRPDPQRQLDRIEAKLDALLQRLGSAEDVTAAGSPAPSGTSDPARDPSAAAADMATSRGAGAEPEAAPTPTDMLGGAESYTPGAIAVAHAALTRGQPLGEIPADSIGGFVYTGGPIRLSDLSDRGVRYAGPAGIELQGWLRAVDTGRHQIAADLQVRFGPGAITSLPCSLNGWLEDQAIGAGTGTVDPWGAKGEPVPLSLVLGAELQPGLYKLRLWIACADLPTARDGDSVQLEVLVKGPGEMNLGPVTGEELLHRR